MSKESVGFCKNWFWVDEEISVLRYPKLKTVVLKIDSMYVCSQLCRLSKSLNQFNQIYTIIGYGLSVFWVNMKVWEIILKTNPYFGQSTPKNRFINNLPKKGSNRFLKICVKNRPWSFKKFDIPTPHSPEM